MYLLFTNVFIFPISRTERIVIGINFIMNSYTCMTKRKLTLPVIITDINEQTTSNHLPIIEHKNTTTYTVENSCTGLGKTQKVARLT